MYVIYLCSHLLNQLLYLSTPHLNISINLSSYLYSILTYAIHINLAQLTLSRLAFWIMFMSNHFPAKKGDGMLSRESLKQETKVLIQEGVCFY